MQPFSKSRVCDKIHSSVVVKPHQNQTFKKLTEMLLYRRAMTLTAHAAMGAVIGEAVGNPLLGFVIAIAVHFLVDIVPHGDTFISNNFRVLKRRRKQALAYVTADAICAILFVLFIVNVRDVALIRPISLAIAGSVLPDLLVGLFDITKSRYLRWISRLHFAFHNIVIKRYGDVPLRYSLVAQAILILVLQARL